jgi:elongation factor Ts
MSSAKTVKQLRDISGAGMMDCKKALEECDFDIDKAMDILRKNGIAKAQKKAGRDAKDGIIIPYIHPGSKLGVLVEINCETDFVARTEAFQDFSRDIAMHIAATSPIGIKREDIAEEVIEKEKEIYRDQALQSGKPDNIIEKMIEGRLNKFYQETVLLEQSFVKDPDKVILDLLNDTISTLGENIEIKRFSRFQLGELAKSEDNS